MNSDNIKDFDPNNLENEYLRFEPFSVCELELMQHLAIQIENVLAPILQKYGIYYYIQATNEFADQAVKNTQLWCKDKRSKKDGY